jgi:hypothetical protein
MPKKKMTEQMAIEAIRDTFADRYFLAHPKVLNCVPDAMTLTLEYFRISGFEIKTTRTDWLSELRSKKNGAARDVCNYWSIIGEADVVFQSDLPNNWGLYRVVSGRLACEVEPTDMTPGRMLDRDLVSRLLHCVAYQIPETEQIRRIRDKAYGEAFQILYGMKTLRNMGADRLQALVRIFETRKHVHMINTLSRVKTQVEVLLSGINECLSSIPKEKDWESGNDFSPEAIEFGEKLKTELMSDRAHGEYFRNNPDILKLAVENRMKAFMGLGIPGL